MSLLQETIEPAGHEDCYAGARALWAKVIIRAIFDWVSYRDSLRLQQRKLAESAEIWLFQRSELFNSFENICGLLDIAPERVRERARKMTKEEVAKIEHTDRMIFPIPGTRLLKGLGENEGS